MKPPRLLVALVLLAASTTPSAAALIFGSIKVGARPLANHKLELTCGSAALAGSTDERGSYNLRPAQRGSCTLALTYDGQALSYQVHSQERPARYDLEVARGDDGSWTLRRR